MRERILTPIIAALALACLTGCPSSAVIRSNPAGADVYLNGARVGRTPYVQTDTDIAGSTKSFELRLAGYEPATVSISRNDWGNARTVLFGVGGFCIFPLWAGLLWSPDYTQPPEVQLDPARPRVSVPPPAAMPPPPPPAWPGG